MKLKWFISFTVILFLCLFALFFMVGHDSAVAAQNGSEKIESSLLDQINAEGSADFILQFNEQTDLSAAYSMDWVTRGEYVYTTLQETAVRSQANARRILDAQNLTYQTFLASNSLYVFGRTQATKNSVASARELTALDQLAALTEVASIQATRTYSIDPVVETNPFARVTWAGDLLADQLLTTVLATSATTSTMDWGITDTKANQFWTTFGDKGNGIVVANIDTGVQWNHPALVNEYKCQSQPGSPACWFEPVAPGNSSICGGSPCDNIGHGTHTMGTMIADDASSLPYTVGMAPEAQWIACKGCENDNCTTFSLGSCANWILAPGGNPANRPNVVNNSWGGGSGDTWFLSAVNAWRAAGIFPAFSAGNFGPACGSLASPGDYQVSFSTAAHDSPDYSRSIASFSSRGPGTFGDEPYTKPNITAPGVNIISTFLNNQWASGNGTSMASPHTAGAVALLWSCNRSLVGNIDATFRLLQDTADDPSQAGDCGAPADGQGNFTYGYGYLNVLAAGQATCNIVNPQVLFENLETNQSKSVNILLTNPAASTMNWNLEVSPAGVTWLGENPTSGSIAPGGNKTITMTFNATGLSIGLYQSNLIIHSNNPYTPAITVPVNMLVGIPTFLPFVARH